MEKDISILKLEKDGEDGLIVTFSDRTTGAYAVEDLLGLQVLREPVEKSKGQDLEQVPQS